MKFEFSIVTFQYCELILNNANVALLFVKLESATFKTILLVDVPCGLINAPPLKLSTVQFITVTLESARTLII